MATVSIEGVPFELEDASELAKRLKRASAGESRPGLSPAHALAVEIDETVSVGSGNVEIRDEARPIAVAVLEEWGRSGPESVKQLRRLLAQPPQNA